MDRNGRDRGKGAALPAHSPYSAACWRRFREPRHVGPPAPGQAMVTAVATGRADDAEVRFWLQPRPRAAWFLAHGGPWLVAAAELCCESWQAGEPVPDAHGLSDRLGAPPDRLDAFITVEDAWQALLARLQQQTANNEV
ncbi:hypothetical protein [Natronospira bacteriovora]|uniref:Uncharacterized protein n=1 Tax=Natronospira bacteriovora TaxID=3069753 RepID=A0ABU0W3X8_9GAMM|nr:hypothetical protein [Natronospira sp. AB-CW4]MDQ2068718.1 hypothetical protein [Natronospira sp. AB-CW4]